MRIATWNLNNRVGRVTFRPEAATAAVALKADLIAFNEFYPRENEQAFREVLSREGLVHQVSSAASEGAAANRVLIASRMDIEQVELEIPAIDVHLPANVLGVRVKNDGLTVVALRVPAYSSAEAPHLAKAWDWLTTLAARLRFEPAVLLGDFNAALTSGASLGGRHLRSMLESGWSRAATVGPTYFGLSGAQGEIDHILATRSCELTNPVVATEIGGFQLAGTSDAISDHAALMCDVKVLGA